MRWEENRDGENSRRAQDGRGERGKGRHRREREEREKGGGGAGIGKETRESGMDQVRGSEIGRDR